MSTWVVIVGVWVSIGFGAAGGYVIGSLLSKEAPGPTGNKGGS